MDYRPVFSYRAEKNLVFVHCKLHGKKIMDGLYRVPKEKIGNEIEALMIKYNIGYTEREKSFYISIHEDDI